MMQLLITVAIFGLLAVMISRRALVQDTPVTKDEKARLADMIDDLLPQTQCGECGFPGCRPYAEAVADSRAGITLCPPGGSRTVNRLAHLLGRTYSRQGSAIPAQQVARIDATVCIGCVKCIKACPVDAIVGAAGQLHAIIPAFCTGCKLCIPPCPVDCISMVSNDHMQS